MADFVGPLLKLVSCIATPTCNYVDHYKNFDDAVNELRDKLGDLNRRKQDIESRIQAEPLAGQIVKEEVQGWIQHVQTINEDVQAVLEKAQRVKWYRKACLGKHVRRKIDVVKEVHERGSFTGSLVIARAPAPGINFSTENLEGEISTKDEIWKYLMGNEIGMIGVCGIGGVGKTTIMKHINDDLLRENRFQKVIWITVSYPLDVFDLQKKIASVMGKTLPEDEQMRREELKDIMGKVSFVLILDDVWEKFSLEDIGIPDPRVQNGCKVVITSRSIEVCNYLRCKIVKVQPLSQEESLKLFLRTIEKDDVSQVTELKDILKLIVEECAGLPLAIVVIAGIMRGVDDVNVWRNTLIELQECVKSVTDWDEKIFKQLRYSYDRLDGSDIKKCFLYCSLFREDYEFSNMEVIEGWIDDGLIDIADLGKRESAYCRGHAFLDKLVKNHLIEKTVSQDEFGDVFKMHDVVRDMAIKSICPEFGYMVKKLRGVWKELGCTKDVRKLSLIHISKLPVSLSLKCHTLSTLILSDNHHLSEIPESLFEDMGTLKVLDLSHTNIEALPDSISNLENLTALRLRSCWRLRCLPSLQKLKALKKLDLKWAGIKVVPKGMEMLECLEYLDLYCHHLEEIPTGILSKLSNLQYLVTAEEFGVSWVRINVEELARLRKLEILECDFGDMKDFNYFLSEFNFRSLTTCKLKVGLGANSKDFHGLEFKFVLRFGGCDIGKECIVLPDRLQHLSIHECKNMRSSLNKTALIENATELSRVVINGCEEIENVVELDSSSSSLCRPVLDKLERLCLWDLPRLCVLIRVEGGSTPPGVFSSLKRLEVRGCSGMRKLLPLELLQALQNLELIEVENCKQMEEIIASSDSDSSSNKFTFTCPKLTALHFFHLPQLKSICSAKGVMVCDSIEEICIEYCRELKRIPVQLPLLENGQPSPPPRLRQILLDNESKEWWESVKWDHPNAKNLLQPFVKYRGLRC